jgi:hypothetical protein
MKGASNDDQVRAWLNQGKESITGDAKECSHAADIATWGHQSYRAGAPTIPHPNQLGDRCGWWAAALAEQECRQIAIGSLTPFSRRVPRSTRDFFV